MPAQTTDTVHGTILVIEDSIPLANVVVGMLEELGFPAKAVKNSEEALGVLGAGAVQLVISDIELPGSMNGYGFALGLKRERPQLPVLLMTGNAVRATEAARDFLVLAKPFGIGDLNAAIEAALARAKA